MKCHPKLLQALTLHKPALHWHHRHSICQPLLIFTVSWSQAAHLTMWPWPSSAGVVLRAEGLAWGRVRSTALSLGEMLSGLAPGATMSEGSVPLLAPV